MFWVLIVLLLAQAFFMAKGIQNVPAFLYHMYSKDHQPMDSIPVILVKTPKGYLNVKQLSGREEEMLMNSVSYYVKLKRSGDVTIEAVQKRFSRFSPGTYQYLQQHLLNDQDAMDQFPNWWYKYFKTVNENTDSITVVQSYVYSKYPYNKSPQDSVIFSIK